MRYNQVKETLNGKVDPAVIAVIEQIVFTMHDLKKLIREAASSQNQMADVMVLLTKRLDIYDKALDQYIRPKHTDHFDMVTSGASDVGDDDEVDKQ